MPKKLAWWSEADDKLLREIQEVGRPAVKRYRSLVAKGAGRTKDEEVEMLKLGKLVNKLERAFISILGKNPLKRAASGK